MKKIILSLTFFCAVAPAALAFSAWEKPPQPPNTEPLQTLIRHPLKSAGILAASSSEVFECGDGGTWKALWKLGGSSGQIHQLVRIPSMPAAVVLLTRDGAFLGNLKDGQLRRIYRGYNAAENSALSFAVSPDDGRHWWMGTEGGLFESRDAGNTWSPFPFFRREPISILHFHGGRLLVGTRTCLYMSADLQSFRAVVSLIPEEKEWSEENAPEELLGSEMPEALKVPVFYDLVLSAFPKPQMWLASKEGVFASRDGGSSWHLLERAGLPAAGVRSVVYDETAYRLFAGTDKGVYVYKPVEHRWEEIVAGLDHTAVFGLAASGGETPALAAVTAAGLYRYGLNPEMTIAPESPEFRPESLSAREPSFEELREMIIRANDVSGAKIRRWHMQSRLRALLPTFYFSRSLSRGNSIDIDRGGTADPDKYISGPDDLSRDVDMNISWDLGDLVWSTAQTSIDSRSKLDAEFRRDLLAEAARIYFERRRLEAQMEEGHAMTDTARRGNLNRIEELTALLDAMSGGEFSGSLRR